MPKSLERREAAYLLEIYRLVEEGRRVSTVSLARRLGVKPPSAVDVLRRLEVRGLIKRRTWGGVELSRRGKSLAKKLIHRHRVLETFFNSELKLEPLLACEEAAKIDYLVSDRVVKGICKMIGSPNLCLHGKPMVHESCD